MLTSMIFALLVVAAQQKKEPKNQSILLFSIKISLTHLLVESVNAPLNEFLSVTVSWPIFKPACLSRLVRFHKK